MSEAEDIADLAVQAHSHPKSIVTKNGREFLIVPEGHRQTEITLPNATEVLKPKNIAASVTLQNADALIDYVNRFKGEDSLLFSDVADSKIVAAIDYHGAQAPALIAHRAILALPFSEEWKTWSAINGQLKPQLASVSRRSRSFRG